MGKVVAFCEERREGSGTSTKRKCDPKVEKVFTESKEV
jgi:hypothetical protein